MFCCVYLRFLLSFFAVVYNKIIYSVTVLRKYPRNVLLVLFFCPFPHPSIPFPVYLVVDEINKCNQRLTAGARMLIIHFGIHVGVDIRVDRETN